MESFYFLSFLRAWDSTTILNKNSDSGHLYLIRQIRGNLLLFIIEYNISSEFITYYLYYIEIIFLVSNLMRLFLKKDVILSFFTPIGIINFIFYSIYSMYYIYWFVYIEQPLHPRDKCHLVFYILLFMCCSIELSNIFLKSFHLFSLGMLIYNFFFFCLVFSVLV